MKIQNVFYNCPKHGKNLYLVEFPVAAGKILKVCASCFAEVLRILLPHNLEVVVEEVDMGATQEEDIGTS